MLYPPNPTLSLALLGFPRLTARSVGLRNPLSLAHILPPIQPHQPKRNLNKQSHTYNSPPSQLHSHPTAPAEASNTSPPHSPQPIPNPAEYQFTQIQLILLPRRNPTGTSHDLLRHKPLRSQRRIVIK
jgi:hypothetical protein